MDPTYPWKTPKVQKAIRCALVLMLVLLLPVFVISFFNRPSADDYICGAAAHAVVANGGGLAELLRTAWAEDIRACQNWGGMYVASFLAALQPGIFGSRWYAIAVFLIAGFLFLCLWGAARLVLGRLLSAGRALPAAAAMLFLLMFVEGMPNQVEGLFWYGGAVVYQPFFALAVLNAAFAFVLAWDGGTPHRRTVAYLLAHCVCSFLICGGHLVAGLLNVMMQTTAAVLALLCQPAPGKRRNLRLLPGMFVSVAALLLNASAPGVRGRASTFHSASIPEAFVKSFVLAALELVRWMDVPLFCFLALLTPLCWWVVQHNRADLPLFRHFWLAPAVTFVLMWGMIFLPSYSMGGIGPGRLIDLVWMTFILGATVSYTALLGWFVHIRGADFAAARHWIGKNPRCVRCIALAAFLLICCIGGRTVKEGLDNRFATSLEAVWELGQGYPQRFAAAMDEREAALTAPGDETVTIHPLTEKEIAGLLYFVDVSPEQSWGIGGYYGRSVKVE